MYTEIWYGLADEPNIIKGANQVFFRNCVWQSPINNMSKNAVEIQKKDSGESGVFFKECWFEGGSSNCFIHTNSDVVRLNISDCYFFSGNADRRNSILILEGNNNNIDNNYFLGDTKNEYIICTSINNRFTNNIFHNQTGKQNVKFSSTTNNVELFSSDRQFSTRMNDSYIFDMVLTNNRLYKKDGGNFGIDKALIERLYMASEPYKLDNFPYNSISSQNSTLVFKLPDIEDITFQLDIYNTGGFRRETEKQNIKLRIRYVGGNFVDWKIESDNTSLSNKVVVYRKDNRNYLAIYFTHITYLKKVLIKDIYFSGNYEKLIFEKEDTLPDISDLPQIVQEFTQVALSTLSTPTMQYAMELEGVKQDYLEYSLEKFKYDKQLEAEQQAKYEAYELLLKENPNLTWEEFEQQYGNTSMMNLSLVERLEDPEIPESVKKFMEKYL